LMPKIAVQEGATMGANYLFTCKSCGYSADVSGGPDVGMLAATRTVSCSECQELYDVVVSENAWDDELKQNRIEPRCPTSKKHSVTLWEHPSPCPKCGKKMKRGKMSRLWD
jgi:hypothetical protein